MTSTFYRRELPGIRPIPRQVNVLRESVASSSGIPSPSIVDFGDFPSTSTPLMQPASTVENLRNIDVTGDESDEETSDARRCEITVNRAGFPVEVKRSTRRKKSPSK